MLILFKYILLYQLENMPRSKKFKKHKRLTTYAFNKPNKPEHVVVVGSKSNKSDVKAEKETKEKLAENPKKRNLIKKLIRINIRILRMIRIRRKISLRILIRKKIIVKIMEM